MGLLSRFRSVFITPVKTPSPSRKRVALRLEELESRLVPYSVTGNMWPNAQLISISFVPDGTSLSSAVGSPITSNLFSTFNAKFGSTAAWQTQILKAAQVWAQATNINFEVVSDDGASSGAGNYQQGDPGMGDIRIGGYAMGNSTLAVAYEPPPQNNYSIAGDITFNTGQAFNIGSTYDLFTVACHEFGHALGMDHTSSGSNAIMWPSYTSAKGGLTSDDIAGIRNIYSSNLARTPDLDDALLSNNSVATATNVTLLIDQLALTALVSNVDITTTSDSDYYTFSAPLLTSSTMTVQVQSQGLSLLSPKVIVYAANGTTVLGSASGLNQYGTTLDVTVTGVTPGQQYFVKVQGADTTAFSTGAYALALNFGTGATPVAASPSTPVLNGIPLNGGGGVADRAGGGDELPGSSPLIGGIFPDNGSSSDDGVTDASRIAFYGNAPAGDTVQLYLAGVNGAPDQLVGTALTFGTVWGFDYTNHVLADGDYLFYAKAVDPSGQVSNISTTFGVTIDTVVPAAPVITGFSPQTPTIVGTAPHNSLVTLYRNGHVVGTVAADSSGKWNFTDSLPTAGVYNYTATATDCAGNVSPLSTARALDFVGAAAPVIAGVSRTTVNNLPTLAVTGTAAAGSTVTVTLNGRVLGTVAADSHGSWRYNYSTSEIVSGNYLFSATATDAAGNVSASSSVFKLAIGATTESLQPPSLVPGCWFGRDSSGYAISPDPILMGNAWGNTVITVLDGDTILGTAQVSPSGQWFFVCPPLAPGIHSLRIEDTNLAGFFGLESNVLTIDV